VISKLPELGKKTPEEWINEFRAYFENVRFEFMKVKTFWVPVQSNDQENSHPVETVTVGNSAYIGFAFSREINQVKEVVCRFIPTTTGTIDYTFNFSNASVGEVEDANTASLTADGLAVTDDVISEIDITSLFDDVVKDDQVGVKFTLDAVATTTSIKILGLYFKYI